MAAPYEATGSMTDDESFVFTVKIEKPDGSSITWADYTFDYELSGCGVKLALDEANGILIDAGEDFATISADPDYRLRAGQYRQGFRCTHIATGIVTQLFDGTITVTEGNFR